MSYEEFSDEEYNEEQTLESENSHQKRLKVSHLLLKIQRKLKGKGADL